MNRKQARYRCTMPNGVSAFDALKWGISSLSGQLNQDWGFDSHRSKEETVLCLNNKEDFILFQLTWGGPNDDN